MIECPKNLTDIVVKVVHMGGQDDEHTRNYYSNCMEWIGYSGKVLSLSRGMISRWQVRIDGGTKDGHAWEPIVYVGRTGDGARSYLYGKVTKGSIEKLVTWYEETMETHLYSDFLYIREPGKIEVR